MKGVCPPHGMLHVLFATKLPLRGEFNSTVVVKTISVYFGIVLVRMNVGYDGITLIQLFGTAKYQESSLLI